MHKYIIMKIIYDWFYLLGCDDQQRIKKDMEVITHKQMSILEALSFALFPPQPYDKGGWKNNIRD